MERSGDGNVSDFVISNGRRVVNVAFLLVGHSPASDFYIPTFRNNLYGVFRRSCGFFTRPTKSEQSVPKRRHMKFRRRRITPKKNTALKTYV